MSLVSIETEDEGNLIQKEITKKSSYLKYATKFIINIAYWSWHIFSGFVGHFWWWTSGSDEEFEGDWLWTATGEPFNYDNWTLGITPNNFGGVEHYLQVYAGWSPWGYNWNDRPGTDLDNSICESLWFKWSLNESPSTRIKSNLSKLTRKKVGWPPYFNHSHFLSLIRINKSSLMKQKCSLFFLKLAEISITASIWWS